MRKSGEIKVVKKQANNTDKQNVAEPVERRECREKTVFLPRNTQRPQRKAFLVFNNLRILLRTSCASVLRRMTGVIHAVLKMRVGLSVSATRAGAKPPYAAIVKSDGRER